MRDRSCADVLPQGDQTDKKGKKKKSKPSFQQFLNSAALFPQFTPPKKVMDEVVKFRSQLVSASELAVSIL